MNDIEQMNESEKQQFTDFKRKLAMQAAQSEVGKLEQNALDASIDKSELHRICQAANTLKIGAVCVLPALVRQCVNFLGAKPQTSLIACISYPHGGESLDTKIAAVKDAVKSGVDEVEVTVPISFIKDGNWGYVKREFKALKSKAKKCTLRLNIECGLLTPQEIAKVSTIAADCGITSLRAGGAYGSGFNAEVLSIIKSAVKDRCTIKADGVNNITDMNTAVSMGAGIIGSKNALDLARLIMQAAD